MPISTTRFAGSPKYDVTGGAFRDRNAKSRFRQGESPDAPVLYP